MGISLAADPAGDYPWPLKLTLACDSGCSRSNTIVGSDYITVRAILTQQGWTERQDPRRFVCPVCSRTKLGQLTLFAD